MQIFLNRFFLFKSKVELNFFLIDTQIDFNKSYGGTTLVSSVLQ